MVDDHEMMADGLSAVLGGDPGVSVVGIATTGNAALDAADAKLDVAVVDFQLPDMDGGEVTVGLKRRCPGIHVVLLTAADGYGVVSRAIAAGAEGFVHKSSPIDEIVDAVMAVAVGRVVVPARDAGRRGRGPQGPAMGSRPRPHRSRARGPAVAGQRRQHHRDGRVASFLSPHTVRNHVRNVLAKLDAHSKLEAVAIALRVRHRRVGDHDDESLEPGAPRPVADAVRMVDFDPGIGRRSPARLAALGRAVICDTPPEPAFDRLTAPRDPTARRAGRPRVVGRRRPSVLQVAAGPSRAVRDARETPLDPLVLSVPRRQRTRPSSSPTPASTRCSPPTVRFPIST